MVRRKASDSPFAIYCWFIQVLIVLSLVAVVMWLSTRPRNPKFTIASIYVPEISNLNLSKVQQNETIRNNSLVFVLEITNPNNGMTICYRNIDINVHSGGFLVWNKSVESFCQGQKKTVSKEMLINDDQQFRGPNAGLRVTVETMLKYCIFKWKTRIKHMGFEGFVRIGTERNITENIYLHKTAYVTP